MADDKQPQPPLTPLDEKILRVLSDRVILKPLTRWNEAYKEFPRFVMEYLVSRYVDPADPLTGQHKIDKILTEHYSESAKKELIKSRIKERGQYTLLGQLTVRLDQGRDHYWASVPALGDDTVRVSQKVLAQYADVLMTSGAWGTMEMEYDGTYDIKGRKFPFYIREFTPLQYTRLNLDDFVEKRSAFTDDEWLDLLVQSIGFNPTRFDRRVKLLMLMRIVPFVESNFNLIELGPRETGKTYTFRNTSSRSFVVSGGKATPATLFYNKATRNLGVVGLKHVVFFDEIANTRFDDAEASISVLKDYMAEIFAELRRRNFQTHVNAWVDLGAMTGRNQDAVKKTTAGLLKLLHPHRSPDTVGREEIASLVETAVEMRKRVTDQLAKILPAEFTGVEYGYKVKIGAN